MRRLLVVIFVSFFPVLAIAQTLSGNISNEKGELVAYATVYIEKLKMGTTANSKGYYELKIAAGEYDVTYQSMGYSPVYDKITISESVKKDVVLPVQYYQFPELRIMASGEDPAYSIMRKAIGMANYYLNNIESYKADVYLKGNLVIEKMPKMIQRRVNVEIRDNASMLGIDDVGNISVKEGDLYLMESFNEIEFAAPDKYVQRVMSAKNSFPFDVTNMSPMDYIQASFYQPTIADIAISPLSPQAFSYYKFVFQGATEQGNLLISKIEVVPKRKSQQLFSGHIYIVEDLWCLHSIDLTNENLGGTLRVKQLFIDVDNGMWLPVSHQFTFDFSMLGILANAGYSSSVKYTNVTPNKRLQKPAQIASLAPSTSADTAGLKTEASANLAKIEKILDKGEISNKEMSKLTKLMDKETKNAGADSARSGYGLTGNTTKIVAEDAYKKDKAYWDEVRPIPLSGTERLSVQARDAAANGELVAARRDTSVVAQPVRRQGTKASAVLLGKTWSDDSGGSLRFSGLLNPGKISFNTVDGFNYGVGLRLKKSFQNKHIVSVSPDIGYAFSRQALQWNVSGNYSFGGKYGNSVSVMAGSVSRDMNSRAGMNALMNSLASLFLERNYMKLYEDNYFGANYYVEPAKGLSVNLSTRYSDRRLLENTSSFKIFDSERREYTPNIPENDKVTLVGGNLLLADHRHYEIAANVNYTPGNNRIAWPTFNLNWKHGVNDYGAGGKHFDMVRLQVNMSHEYNLFSSLDWQVGTGGMINGRNASFYDYSHFNSQPFPLVIDHYNDAFLLKPFYYFSTPDMYVDGFAEYTTSYLLVKYIPGISNTLCRENLNVAFIAAKGKPVYYEIGYSISEIFLFAEVGVYAGFEGLKYDNFGVRMAFRFNFN